MKCIECYQDAIVGGALCKRHLVELMTQPPQEFDECGCMLPGQSCQACRAAEAAVYEDEL